MPFLAGDIITAQKLNWLSPIILGAQASSTVAPSSTGVDVPGTTLTPSTSNAGALIKVCWSAAFYTSSGALIQPAAVNFVKAMIDGISSTMLAIFTPDASGASGREQGSGSWVTTLSASGSHTIKLNATVGAGITVQTLTSIDVEIIEAF